MQADCLPQNTEREKQGASVILLTLNIRKTKKTKLIIDGLVAIAEKYEATPGQITFAWTLSKNAFPLLGARNINQFGQALKLLKSI
ncbi:aldo/keto reductase [Chryseobacterium arachidis]|uniref:aldo/keto reductase n=1 Tax=Chryseobacterium arachidis TaxID=1416778 RepID=UPI00361593C6